MESTESCQTSPRTPSPRLRRLSTTITSSRPSDLELGGAPKAVLTCCCPSIRRDGGTGRRSGLKIRRASALGGSIPPPGTSNISHLQRDPNFLLPAKIPQRECFVNVLKKPAEVHWRYTQSIGRFAHALVFSFFHAAVSRGTGSSRSQASWE